MATINGVTFNLTRIIFDTGNRNVLGRSPGSKTNPVSNFGMDGLGIALTGFETSQSDYDNVIAAFMGSGSKALIVRTGWKFDIYSTSNNLSEVEGFADNYFPYRFDLVCSDPYQYSTSETTRAKTITANNQEWSADDSANDITTSGTVEAVPDIQVTGSVSSTVLTERAGVVTNSDFEDALGAEWAYSEVDVEGRISGARVATQHYHGSNCYEFVGNGFFEAASYGQILQNIDLTKVEYLTFYYEVSQLVVASSTLHVRMYVGTDLKLDVEPTSTISWTEAKVDVRDYVGSQDIKFQMYYSGAFDPNDKVQFDYIRAFYQDPTKNPDIYNTADTSIKCSAGNDILDGAIHRINADGTGSIDYDDDFSTTNFKHTLAASLNISYDATDDELDIADDGYIYYAIDTKYPITGIPALTAQINITAGTPTIQISTDGSTWYDIDTAIVDDVDTEYELDNATSLSLKGKTSFYFRIDCGGTGAVTCSVKSFELDINIVTIDAENPVINTGGANTIRCDQDAASGMNCEVSLIYRDRKWAA